MSLSRREFLMASGLVLAAPALGRLSAAPSDASLDSRGVLGVPWRVAQAGVPAPEVHALSRLAFGPTAAELQAVRDQGVGAWIDRQLAPDATEPAALTQALAGLPTLDLSINELLVQYPLQGGTPPNTVATVIQDIQRATLLRKVYSQWQLREVLIDFWTDHLNIYIGKELCRHATTVYVRDVLRPHALGNFHALLSASAHSPAMMSYLDNDENRAQAPNENYAREIMELHTLGVDGGYNQRDVEQLAKCFTGWTYYPAAPRIPQERWGQFYFEPNRHDTTTKTVLGNTIQGVRGADGIHEAETVIRILADHRSTARFLATKLVRKLVADDPPPALVSRIADLWYEKRNAPDQIAVAVKAITEAPEFTQSYGQKTRRPLDFVAAALRVVGAQTSVPFNLINRTSLFTQMGQPLYGREFPDGYADKGIEWINTNGLLARWNFALALVENRLPGTRVDLLAWFDQARPATAAALVDALLQALLGYTVDAGDRDALIAYVNQGTTYSLTNPTIRTVKLPRLTALILASPYFQAR